MIAVTLSVWFLTPSPASAATDIYYSVGQNTADHKTGEPTVSITGGVATFSLPQTGTTTGIGDKVTYNTSGIAYITGKISTSQWTLRSATGSVPADVTDATVNSIAHAFNSINSALATTGASSTLGTGDLARYDYALHIPCYYDSGPDTIAAHPTIGTTWILDEDNYLRIYTPTSTTSEVNLNQRHSGKWDTSKYRMEVDAARRAFAINAKYVRIDGLQMGWIATYAGAAYLLDVYNVAGSSDFYFSNLVLRGSLATGYIQTGIYLNDADINAKIWNVSISGLYDGLSNVFGINANAYNTAAIYNATILGGNRGISRATGVAATSTLIVKNTIVQNSVTAYFGSANYSASSTNNLSHQASAPGLNPISSTTTFFVSSSTGDLHLVSTSTNAIEAGVELSNDPDGYISFTTDIDGDTRTGSWDVGADEYVSGADTTAPVISSVASSTSATTATITWTTDEASTSTVEYGATDSYGSTSSSVASVSAHEILITGLTENTLYHFRVKSQDAAGNVATSTDYTFRTTDATAPTITSVASSTSATTATITWTTNESSTSTVEYGATDSYGSTSSSVVFATSHEIVIENLSANTLYHFQLSSIDASGNTTTTEDYTFRTAPDTTDPTVSSFTVPSTASSLTVSITAFTATDNIGVTGYLVNESASEPALDDAGWSASAPSSYTFASQGSKTLYAWGKDAAGNISTSLTGSVTITIAASATPASTQAQGGTAYESPYQPGFQMFNPSTQEMSYGPSTEALLQSLALLDIAIHALVKLPDDGNPLTQVDTTVYLVDGDGMRHAFPNAKVYFSWYDGFSNVTIVSPSALASIPLGSNVRYKPGVRMVKFQTDPKCYAVSLDGILRWVRSEEIAAGLYGGSWQAMIDDISDAFFTNYTFGDPIDSASEFDPQKEAAFTDTP